MDRRDTSHVTAADLEPLRSNLSDALARRENVVKFAAEAAAAIASGQAELAELGKSLGSGTAPKDADVAAVRKRIAAAEGQAEVARAALPGLDEEIAQLEAEVATAEIEQAKLDYDNLVDAELEAAKALDAAAEAFNLAFYRWVDARRAAAYRPYVSENFVGGIDHQPFRNGPAVHGTLSLASEIVTGISDALKGFGAPPRMPVAGTVYPKMGARKK